MYSELFRCVVMILVASLGIESAFSHDWQIARATLLDAAQCSESIPSADMVIDMKVGAASNDRFADRLIHYHVITDWERAFVQWKETRARDQDMPTIYSEWSFDGTVKRCNPFSPDRSYVANEILMGKNLSAIIDSGNSGDRWIDPRGFGILPSPYTQEWMPARKRMEEFLKGKESLYECLISPQILAEQGIAIEMRTKHPSEIDRKWVRRYLFELTAEPRRITKAQMQNFKEWGTWTNPIRENTVICTYPDVSHAGFTIPETLVHTTTENGIVKDHETWKISFALADSMTVTSALPWNNFTLTPGRIIHTYEKDGPHRMQWDGSKIIVTEPLLSTKEVVENRHWLVALWPWANVLLAFAATGYVIYRKLCHNSQKN